jgi:hypothetical protein
MGGGVKCNSEKNLSSEIRVAVDFRNAEPVVLPKVELSSMYFRWSIWF